MSSTSRIKKLFDSRKNDGCILSVYCTAGFPELNSTLEVIEALDKHGADMMELGMPYSDPLADGPVIQASSARAISNGMSILQLFKQLKDLRTITQMPIVLMGYMNPVLQYGFERFCRDASKAGIDGLIIPDLPEYEFETEYGPIIRQHGLDFIFLITPETPELRIRKLDELSSGFLYAVSSSSTTGKSQDTTAVAIYLSRIKAMRLKNPVIVGFGIRDHSSFMTACQYANGGIIGTAYIKAIENAEDVGLATKNFLSSFRG